MYYNESTLVFLDGNWVKASEISVSPYSQTLHYGIGVFEGIRSYKTEDGNKIFKAKEHFERLQYYCNLLICQSFQEQRDSRRISRT